MTNHVRGPSLFQARDQFVDPSSVTSDSHTRFAANLQNRHAHYSHPHQHTRQQDASNHHHGGDTEDQQPPPPAAQLPRLDPAVAQPHSDDGAASDTPSLEARSLAAAVDATLAVRAQDDAPSVTQVVQTISIVQVVDTSSGSPDASSTEYATPNTVVDRSTGETVSQSGPTFNIAINPNSPVPGLGSGSSSSTPSTTSSTHLTMYISPQSVSAPSPSSSVSRFPTLSDTSNGTTWGNNTIIITPTNSTTRPVPLTQSLRYNSSKPSDLHVFTSSSSSNDTDTASSASSSSTWSSTPTWNPPTIIPTVAGSAETTSVSSSASEVNTLTTQQKQIVGGVVGSVAGVAFLALLVMLALRYKRRQEGSESLPSSTQTRGIPALCAPGNDSANPMAERTAAASSINAAFAAFAAMAGKRQSRSNATTSLDTPEISSSGERGFYRISGRKLPSVLYTGGDGYTDPRQSTMSQYSQSSEPFNRGDEPFALGSPMRPVSGVPIMRSGPARTPVTEANPFADPIISPPPTNASPPRRPGSSGSARGSSSRFQESI